MKLICKTILKKLPILKFDLYNKKESSFLIKTNRVCDILTLLKTHFRYQYKILACISGLDYPENFNRFQIVYELISVKYNTRLKIKILTDELTPIHSSEKIFIGSAWWECEIWDMFGIFFTNQNNLTRLLTDYGFQGYPLRKDFPLSGFIETRYNAIANRVGYESVELSQEYRSFDFESPWNKKLI